MRWLVAIVVLAACDTPPMRITYFPSDGTAQSCGSNNCADIKIPCDAVVSIRVLNPSDPTAPYVSICEDVPDTRNKDLCAISGVDLGMKTIELPKETLEVQIVIWPREQAFNVDTNMPDCGQEVKFDAVAGFPIAQQPTPAIGGHAFYHPGDEEVRVELGCTDLMSVQTCSIDDSLDVTATVESFENLGVLVSVNEGSRFKVDVGEPLQVGASEDFTLPPADTRQLPLTVVGVVPIWRGNVDISFTDYGCVQVLEDSAQATAAVKCTSDNIPPTDNTLEMRGVQFPKATLDQVLGALLLTQFPQAGITVGIVVDSLFNPVPGQMVTSNQPATIRYLSADRMSVGGTTTSASGIFVSLDAKFGTTFSVAGSKTEVGGRIGGKVTVVVIEK